MLDNLWLIPILPLAGFLINILLGLIPVRKPIISVVGVGSVAAATVASYVAIWELLGSGATSHLATFFTWIQAGSFEVSASFLLDPLSMVMIGFVSFVGLLIHLYSVGYMHGESDSAYARYFAYLNLFMFSMLLLVLGSNLPILFIGWEGVGLCSYLLIGFYFDKDWCADAGKKAFVTNRIGDFGFLLAIFAAFATFQSVEFGTMFSQAAAAPELHQAAVTFIALLLFIGAIGKSAQIPLYVWLPDAMAGPTPVSALIHAATMVTAGVYMVVRCNVFYRISPTAMLVVAIVGGLTAIFAATIGLAQNDIKKVLAYSTVSQLGYMFLGAGVMGFVAAIFHVVTHAFFKACLFLGSGSVIHACGGNQDIRSMGGLRKKMPITFWTFLFATIAIAGIVPFAGFFSKDEILAKAFAAGYGNLNGFGAIYYVLWGLAVAGAFLTALYMFRLVSLTFFGEFRGGEEAEHHIHESPWTMTVPLIVLGALSLVGGLMGVPGHLFGKPEWNKIEHFLHPILPEIQWAHEHAHHAHPSIATEWALVGLSLLVAAAGIAVALWLYWAKADAKIPESLAKRFSLAYRMLVNKYWVDELYSAVILQPIYRLAQLCWKVIDVIFIDGFVNFVAFMTELIGDLLRFLQTGNVRNYALFLAMGILILAVVLI
jgi:NADH-quinone oxidoreductase subunit L